MKVSFCVTACILAMQPGTAAAQDFPKRVDQPVIDPYGVEIKSGRFGDLSIPVISIGGDGVQVLTRTYAPQNGRELLVQSIYDVHTSSQLFNSLYYYDIVRYQTPTGTVTFRRPTGSTGPYEAENASKGTLSGGWFTDKYGVKYGEGKVVYPDGREIWGGTTSAGVDPNFSNTVPVMRNNFGFLLKTVGNVTQAVNLARNYCDFNSGSLCTGLSATRTASVVGTGTQHYVVTNAAGEVVDVQLQSIEAFDRKPTCVQDFNQPCTYVGTRYAYNYPVLVSFPGSTKPSISISYKAGNPQTATHNDIIVQNVTRNGIAVTYFIDVSLYAGGGNAPTGSQVTVRSFVNGAEQFHSYSNNIGRDWAPSTLDLKYVTDGLGRSQGFFYDNDGNVVKALHPEGDDLSYEYDSRLNITKVIINPKPGSGLAPLVTNYEYPTSCDSGTQATCNLPIAMVDPKGGRTEYTYNAYGQVLTKTDPAPSPGAARPTVRNSYVLRTAYILDASGTPIAAGAPISMLATTSTCLTTENCAGTTDEVVTAFDYGPLLGPNNLLLRGVTVTATNGSGQPETLRTCYGYNYFGERVSETKPRAGLATCP